MTTTRLLTRGLPPVRPGPDRPFAEGAGLGLARGRVHELCGPARRTLALAVAGGAGDGPVLWIRPGWVAEQLYPLGIRRFCDPGRLILATCLRAEDLLWSAEEALRSGAVGLVVADLPAPPGLTPVRRLHLAAEAGGARSGMAPLGLLLTPGAGGAAGVESRWHMTPRHTGKESRWQLERRRARGAAPGEWMLTQDRAGLRPAP